MRAITCRAKYRPGEEQTAVGATAEMSESSNTDPKGPKPSDFGCQVTPLGTCCLPAKLITLSVTDCTNNTPISQFMVMTLGGQVFISRHSIDASLNWVPMCVIAGQQFDVTATGYQPQRITILNSDLSSGAKAVCLTPIPRVAPRPRPRPKCALAALVAGPFAPPAAVSPAGTTAEQRLSILKEMVAAASGSDDLIDLYDANREALSKLFEADARLALAVLQGLHAVLDAFVPAAMLEGPRMADGCGCSDPSVLILSPEGQRAAAVTLKMLANGVSAPLAMVLAAGADLVTASPVLALHAASELAASAQ
jgi:hypothetical protein